MAPLAISVLESVALVTVLSTDAFFASFAYGTDKIRIPLLSAAIISGVCSGLLAISLFFGTVVRSLLPPHLLTAVCVCLLLLLGVARLCESLIKNHIKNRKDQHKKISFSMGSLNFILCIYADPKEAAREHSRSLSPAEAFSLALALSLDSLSVGFGAALAQINCLQTVFISLAMGFAAVKGGELLGRRIAESFSWDLSWLSGVLLIVLALMRLPV
ncbi:MAG: sporulation membrane protein YtaF [Peptococcaceae bacterium]|nr:sporulation membrane protein YtaF [Peptococcaceae bacterium]